jgi:peptidoglycan/LPS O-acetylase OafA/YrhL
VNEEVNMGALIVMVLFLLFLVAAVRDGVDSRERWRDRQRVSWPGTPR